MNLADAAAAPINVKLAGRDYTLHPLTMADRAEYDRFLQQRLIRMARDCLSDDMQQRERDEIMDAAFRRAQEVSLATPEGMRVAQSLEGIARMLWMGLRREHPELTPAQVEELVADEQTLRDALDAHDLANSTRGAKKKSTKKRTARKAKPRKSRSR